MGTSTTIRATEGTLPLCRSGANGEQEWLAGLATKESVLFALGDAAPESAIKAMQDAADRGARVYILAKPGFGQAQQEHGLRDRPRAKVLVRRCAHLPFSAALGADGSNGGIWLQEPGGKPGWTLALNVEQSSGLRAAVLHWWWHGAEDEGWTDPNQDPSINFRPPRDRAFDAPPPRTGPVTLVHASVSTTVPDSEFVCVRPDGEPQTGARRLFTPPRGASLLTLESVGRAGCEILWTPLGLPKTWISDHGGGMEWRAGERRVVLNLNGPQCKSIAALLSTTPPEWRMRVDATLGGLAGELLLPDAANAAACTERHEVPCGSVQCERITDVLACQPTALPQPPLLARTVVYLWTALPPRLPGNARKSSLYDQWAQVDRSFADRVTSLQQALEQAQNKSKGFKERLKSFAAQAMGFQSGSERLVHELTDMRQQSPSSLGESDALALPDQLSDLARRVEEFCVGVERDGLKAEEAEQRTEWSNETRRRQDELAALQLQRKQAIDRQQAAQNDLDAGEKTAPTDPNWKAKRASLKDEIEVLKRTAATLAGKSGEHAAWLEKENEFRFRPQQTSSAPRDKGRKFAQAKPSDARLAVPGQTLPRVGILYDAGNVRYLAIKTWEQVGAGEQEARRLEAKLVVE